MKCLQTALAFLLLTGASVAIAAAQPQVFASVEFTGPHGNEAGQTIVVTNRPGFLEMGATNGYLTLMCSGTSRSFKSIMIFSGYVLHYTLKGQEVVLTVEKYAVQVPPKAAFNDSKACISSIPRQRQIVDQTYRLPITARHKSVKLPDGSIMRYSAGGLSH